MRSKIFDGEVMHARGRPVRNVFRYPVVFYAFDLDELEELDRSIPFFGHNRPRPVALYDRDYLAAEDEAIGVKLRNVLAGRGLGDPGRVELITAARFFGHVFNPVSFFYCWGEENRLDCIVAQVRNTFGEMHVYVLDGPVNGSRGYAGHYRAEKVFHVSPFFDRRGEYEFFFSSTEPKLDIIIHYRLEGALTFAARLRGKAASLTPGNLASTLLRRPLTSPLTLPRIWRQAAGLRFRHRLPVFHKPEPDHPMTVRKGAPSLFQRLGRGALFTALGELEGGRLRISLPDGSARTFGAGEESREAVINVRDDRFFSRTLFSGDIGFGESYVDGEWESPDLPLLLRLLADSVEAVKERHHVLAGLGHTLNFLRHLGKPNTLSGSMRNIRSHYDLGNEFFALFLDATMTYSCAIFDRDGMSLEEAQRRKIERIIEKAKIGPDDHVLEIGCGWGSFAVEAARKTGCRVTAVTLSQKQADFARALVRDAGLESRVEVVISDYRNLSGGFSRIVSVEMLEAVGHRELDTFFGVCEELLVRGGAACVQVIAIEDYRYPSYRLRSDWVRKHIFPGGHVPSLCALKEAMARRSRLSIVDQEEIGGHYVRTLLEWRSRLLERAGEVQAMGFDEKFLRLWEYYFAYCAAGFGQGMLRDYQLVLTRENDR